MLYGSAGVADTLCHHNAWDRCSIPMHALQVGLQHRQLDTISFFLKSRENGECFTAFLNRVAIAGTTIKPLI